MPVMDSQYIMYTCLIIILGSTSSEKELSPPRLSTTFDFLTKPYLSAVRITVRILSSLYRTASSASIIIIIAIIAIIIFIIVIITFIAIFIIVVNNIVVINHIICGNALSPAFSNADSSFLRRGYSPIHCR